MFPQPGNVEAGSTAPRRAHSNRVRRTDAPGPVRLALVSVDTMVSGSSGADLSADFLKGQGSVAVTVTILPFSSTQKK